MLKTLNNTLGNGWYAGGTTPATCVTGTSPDFYNWTTGTLYRCINNRYTSTSTVDVDLLAQGANLGPTTFYTVPTGLGGVYRFNCYTVVTRAATTSSTLPGCNVNPVDNDTNVATISIGVTATNTGNTVGTIGATGGANADGTNIINVRAGSTIAYSTTGYASVGATSMQYALHAKLEYLGQ